MSEIVVDLNVLEIGKDKNPFDLLASKLEKLNLEGGDKAVLAGLEKTVLFLERKVMDLNEVNEDLANTIMQAIQSNSIMIESGKINTVQQLANHLETIREVSMAMMEGKVIQVSKNYSIADILVDKFGKRETFNSEQLAEAYNSSLFASRDRKITGKEVWQIDFKIGVDAENSHKPLEFLYFFIESLNSFIGVKAILKEIKIGSIDATVNIQFDDDGSREVVKDLLNSARSLVVKKLNTETLENEDKGENNNGSSDFTNERRYEDKFGSEVSVAHNLQIESLKLDVKRKEIENAKEIFYLMREKKNFFVELFAEGLITQKHLEILIKGISFMSINDRTVTVGEDIDVIGNL